MKLVTAVALMLCTPGRERYQKTARDAFHSHWPNWRQALVAMPAEPGVPVGAMRNRIITEAIARYPGVTTFFNWDDDDLTLPAPSWQGRLRHQQEELDRSGAACVGYNTLYFWDERYHEAWLYRLDNPHYALGTSLCFSRAAWEAVPFPELYHGEDTEWLLRLRQSGRIVYGLDGAQGCCPQMIARIHAGNSSTAYDRIEMLRHDALLNRNERQWSRVPEADNLLAKLMK